VPITRTYAGVESSVKVEPLRVEEEEDLATAKMVNGDDDDERRKMSGSIRGLASNYVDMLAACSRVRAGGDGAARRLAALGVIRRHGGGDVRSDELVDDSHREQPARRATKRPIQAALAAPNIKRRRKGFSSQYWGVRWEKNAWRAQFENEEGRLVCIGSFAVEGGTARANSSAVRKAALAAVRLLNLKGGLFVEKSVRPFPNCAIYVVLPLS